MKKIILLFLLLPLLAWASYSIDVGGAFSSKQLNSLYLTPSVSFTSNLSLSLSVSIFKSESGFGKTFSPILDISFEHNFFIELTGNYLPKLQDYQNSGFSFSLGKTFGKTVKFTPSLSSGIQLHVIDFETHTRKSKAVISEVSVSPSLGVTLFDITDLNFSFTKNRQTVKVGRRKEDLLTLFQQNQLAQKIILYNPTLYSTTANFIDNSWSVSLSQYIFYFFTASLDYTRDKYLLPMDDGTIPNDNIFTLDLIFYITEWLGCDGALIYYTDNMKNKQISSQISVSFYF